MIRLDVPTHETAGARKPSARTILAVAAAITGTAAFVALSAMVWHSTGPLRWERRIFFRALRHPAPGANTWQSLFEPAPFAFMVVGLGLVALFERRPKLALGGTLGCFAAVFTAEEILKPIIDSRQPPERHSAFGPAFHIGSLTFPSGHVTAAAALAAFAWLIFRRRTELALFFFAIPVLVAWAMVSLGLHYPVDALGGFIFGPLVVFAGAFATTLVFGTDKPRPAVTGAPPSGPGRAGSS